MQPAFLDQLIQGIADGFVAFEKGDFFNAPIQTMGSPPMAPFVQNDKDDGNYYAAQTCVKSGYFRNDSFYVIKVASGGHPWENSGMMQIYSQQTGKLRALLLDQGILTEIRTAAVSALILRMLLPVLGEIDRVGVLGTGVQARYQLKLLERVIKCRSIAVYGRSNDKVKLLQLEMVKQGWESVESYSSPDALLEECDIVITTTSARSPILGTSNAKHLKCRLIICIGADAPGKSEISNSLLEQADILVADSVEQSLERGEFQHLQNAAKQKAICSLGAFIKDPSSKLAVLNERKGSPLIVFDSSGVALQDCVIANLAYNHLTKK